ncbi:nucleotide sugar dehydrogenase [Patescibacteria group bacterium]
MNDKNTKVSIIGLGYVGLPIALALVKNKDYQVIGYDIDEKKLGILRGGKNPLKDETTAFLDQYIPGVTYIGPYDLEKLASSNIFIIAVPNPVSDDYIPDYSHVISACNTIGPFIKKGSYVVLETTLNPGTCEEIVIPELERSSGLEVGIDFEVSYCPERINPGDAAWNVLNIPRSVGSYTKEGTKFIADFYRSFLDAPIYEVNSLKVAEATKIVENTFRDVNIALVNELAISFDKMGIDVLEVIEGLKELQKASDKPPSFLAHYPGCGVGGHCIPVDPYFLIKGAENKGFNHKLLKVARKINNNMPQYTVNLLKNELNETKLKGKGKKEVKVGILGLSYKENVGDIRESPAIAIYKLLTKDYQVKFFDSYIDNFKDFVSANSLEALILWSDALILTTKHDEFKEIPKMISEHKNVRIFIDGRNTFNKGEFPEDIRYKGIGR